ncbi:MAG TPA: glycosyltransferase 87 family protein [Acidobacteriaceae bacterium]|jgi:hypothetical protein|nr:glycosyltransferase 87 family protein [Acidobacteriaceae bacterium]
MAEGVNRLRVIADFVVVGICTATVSILFVGICAALLRPHAAAQRDFIEYWASGHQILHHADPYNADAILALEKTAGFPAGIKPQVMGNPPWTLLLMLPLGVAGPMTGELLWVLLLILSLIASVQMVRALHGTPQNLIHLLAYAFAPALSCILAGQVTLFLLLGLVLFYRLHLRQPFLAGISLWLCLLKPHLFLPFGIVLLLWIVMNRRYVILAGSAFAVAASSAIATLLNPHVWTQYARMMRAERIDQLPLPSVSTTLRQYVYPHTTWLQCLPAAIGCAWAIWYFLKHREHWNWIENGSILMLVSVVVAPYSWFFDQAVLIPAFLHAAYRTRSRIAISLLALTSAAIEIPIIRGLELHSIFYLWTAPAWLALYLFATRRLATAADASPAAESQGNASGVAASTL